MSTDEEFLNQIRGKNPNLRREALKLAFAQYAKDRPVGNPARRNYEEFMTYLRRPANTNDHSAFLSTSTKVDVKNVPTAEVPAIQIGHSIAENKASKNQSNGSYADFERELTEELIDAIDEAAEDIADQTTAEALMELGYDPSSAKDAVLRLSEARNAEPTANEKSKAEEIVAYSASGKLKRDIYKGLALGFKRAYKNVVKPPSKSEELIEREVRRRDLKTVAAFFDMVHSSLKVGGPYDFNQTLQPYYTYPQYPYYQQAYNPYYTQTQQGPYQQYPQYPQYTTPQQPYVPSPQRPKQPLQRNNDDLDINTFSGGGVGGMAGDLTGSLTRAGGDVLGQTAQELGPVLTDAAAGAVSKGTSLAVEYGGRAAKAGAKNAAKYGKQAARSLLESARNYKSTYGSGGGGFSTSLSSLPAESLFSRPDGTNNETKSGVFRVKDSVVSTFKDGASGAKRNVKGLAGMLLGTPETSTIYNPQGQITTILADDVEAQITNKDSSFGGLLTYVKEKTPGVAAKGTQAVFAVGSIAIDVVNGVATAIAYAAPNPIMKGSFRAKIAESFIHPDFDHVTIGAQPKFNDAVFEFTGPNPQMIAAKHMWNNGFSDASEQSFHDVFNAIPVALSLPGPSSIKKKLGSLWGGKDDSNDKTSVKQFVFEFSSLAKDISTGNVEDAMRGGMIDGKAVNAMAKVIVSVALGSSSDIKSSVEGKMHVAMQSAFVEYALALIRRIGEQTAASIKGKFPLEKTSSDLLSFLGLAAARVMDSSEDARQSVEVYNQSQNEASERYRKAVEEARNEAAKKAAMEYEDDFDYKSIDSDFMASLPRYDGAAVASVVKSSNKKIGNMCPASLMLKSNVIAGAFDSSKTVSSLEDRLKQLGVLLHAAAVTIASSKEDLIPSLVEATVVYVTGGTFTGNDITENTALSALMSLAGHCAFWMLRKSSGIVTYKLSRVIQKKIEGTSVPRAIKNAVAAKLASMQGIDPKKNAEAIQSSKPAVQTPSSAKVAQPQATAQPEGPLTDHQILEKALRKYPGTLLIASDKPIRSIFSEKDGRTLNASVEKEVLQMSPGGDKMTSLFGYIYPVNGQYMSMHKSIPLYQGKMKVGFSTQDLHVTSDGTVKRLVLEK